MIEAQLLRDDGILRVTPAGSLETADFERLERLVAPYLEKHDSLNGLLIDAESFPGWDDFAGLLSHVRFAREYKDKIKRIAAVSDSGFLRILPAVADHFAAAQVRHFNYEDRDAAVTWLRREPDNNEA